MEPNVAYPSRLGIDRRSLFLFGNDIGHSLSPKLFAAVFQELELPWDYSLCECNSVSSFKMLGCGDSYFAANVTSPFKPAALDIADYADDVAFVAGGANLLIPQSDGLHAWNLDGWGLVLYLHRMGIDLKGESAAVCGTGPTSRSIAVALMMSGCDVVLLSRSKPCSLCVSAVYKECVDSCSPEAYRKRIQTCSQVAGAIDGDVANQAAAEDENGVLRLIRIFQYASESADDAIRNASLVVDATPLGMKAVDGIAFDPRLLSKRQLVLDTVYGHGETTLCCEAQGKGCRFSDGLGMLVGQAAMALPIILDAANVACNLGTSDFFDIMYKVASRGPASIAGLRHRVGCLR